MSSKGLILAIDDDQSMLRLIKTRLSASGYEVLVAADGEEGVRIAAERKPPAA